MAREGGADRGSLRSAARALRGSLAMRCLALLGVYALVLAGLLGGMGALVDGLFDGAFPSMGTVLEYEGELADDRFGALATSRLSNALIVVFDADGRCLYASSERAAERVSAADLAIIGSYAGSSYEVFEEAGEDGEVRYRVMLCAYDGAGGTARRVVDWCVLDADLKVVEGTLFSGRERLTRREFGLIRGLYGARMDISRLDYATSSGESRTLVLATPLVTEEAYARIADAASRAWLLAVPAALAITAVAALLMARLVRRSARPLDRAIAACGEPGAAPELPDARSAGVPTELVPIYEGFSDLMARLRSARDDQARMVASLSHDLKTPLTVMRGYAQAFCEGRVPPEREGAYHRVILERAVAAAELLEELSGYARTEHPDFAPELVASDARELVAGAVAAARPLADQAGCALEVDLGLRPLPVLADARLFRRMLLNLVENAVTHNPPGTRVRVSCAPGPRARTCEVSVADTGEGVSPEVADRIFDPFVTRDAARPSGGGTGLGLAIVRRAAELMGGSVLLRERPAAPWATEFVVTLPFERESASANPEGRA